MESEDAKERKEKDGLRLTLIHNGVIVTMDDESRVYSNGAIVVEGDRIRAIGRSSEILDRFSPLADEIVDLQGQIVLPGFVKMRGGGERTEGTGGKADARKGEGGFLGRRRGKERREGEEGEGEGLREMGGCRGRRRRRKGAE
ncbi:Imidazolonepropionase [Nymphaea thermarum]|nr:Imidazolonepropionase [Nymphaea thermarum]